MASEEGKPTFKLDTSQVEALAVAASASIVVLKQSASKFANRWMSLSANMARGNARSQYGIAKYAGSLVSSSGNTLTYGGEAWAMGAEFGSVTYKQFASFRGSSAGAGYFVYPSIRSTQDEILNDWGKSLENELLVIKGGAALNALF